MDALIRKLNHYTRFTDEELVALSALSDLPTMIAPRQDIIHEGDNPVGVNLVVEGYAIRYKTLPDGRRQILGYFVPGDICDLRVFVVKRMDHSIAALTQVAVRVIPEKRILQITDAYPRIMRALWWATLVEESITREWLLSMGQRRAVERVAHLFCEIYYRMRAVGLVDGLSVLLPLRQTDLAEMTGLSVVHANRVLQELRKNDLIAFDGQTLRIADLARLEEFGMFDPLYLHLDEKQSALPRVALPAAKLA